MTGNRRDSRAAVKGEVHKKQIVRPNALKEALRNQILCSRKTPGGMAGALLFSGPAAPSRVAPPANMRPTLPRFTQFRYVVDAQYHTYGQLQAVDFPFKMVSRRVRLVWVDGGSGAPQVAQMHGMRWPAP
jgi:hypothetical protein